jgi:hypothetical protein
MRPRREAAGQADLQDGLAALLQQALCARQPQLQVVARGQGVEMLLEQALELAPRHADQARHFLGGQRLGEVGLHQRERLGQLGAAGATLLAVAGALALVARTQAAQAQGLHQLLADALAVQAGQPGAAQVQAGGAGRTAEPAAIGGDLPQAGRPGHGGMAVGQAVEQGPVGTGALAVEQPGRGEGRRTRFDAAEEGAGAGPGPQLVTEPRVGRGRIGRQHEHRMPVGRRRPRLGQHPQPGRGHHRAAGIGQGLAAIDGIGLQRVHCRQAVEDAGERQRREAGLQHQPHAAQRPRVHAWRPALRAIASAPARPAAPAP